MEFQKLIEARRSVRKYSTEAKYPETIFLPLSKPPRKRPPGRTPRPDVITAFSLKIWRTASGKNVFRR